MRGISCRRVSVCVSVCLSHAGIVSKQLNVSHKQRRVIARDSSFLTPTVVGGRPPSPWNLLFLPVILNFCRKKSATKFLCVKTSTSKVVATSFLYLMVYRRIAGDVPLYVKFALKVTHPFRNRRFRQISLNSASAVRASEKRSIITNRKLTMLLWAHARRLGLIYVPYRIVFNTVTVRILRCRKITD